ncbi:hypothetical protein [Streptomyces sp. WMMB 714]|nr:hypothetical protein [Streptomyces sp. WMMB 714]
MASSFAEGGEVPQGLDFAPGVACPPGQEPLVHLGKARRVRQDGASG